jgi:ABC-2 type transport system permease protein
MIADLGTVFWKEWKESLAQRSTLFSMVSFLGIFAVLLPYQSGGEWVKSPLAVMNLMFIPLFLVLTIVADGFAGERERHSCSPAVSPIGQSSSARSRRPSPMAGD